MGIHVEVPAREKKPSIRTAAFAVIACLRMQKWQQDWAVHEKLRESLLKKWESMNREKGKAVAR